MNIQVSQDSAAPGAELMSTDAALLQRAFEGDLSPTLRFYTWEIATLSLGFHQDVSQIDENSLMENQVPWVRRPTGGAAVLHSEELTYAIVLSHVNSMGLTGNVQALVGESITQGLRAVGVDAQLDARGEPMTALSNRTSCFVRTSRWEITVKGRKIVGSAQRKLGDALLQHGSILTGDDHLRISQFLNAGEEVRKAMHSKLARHSTSIRQELGISVSEAVLREAMEYSFRKVFASFDLSSSPAFKEASL